MAVPPEIRAVKRPVNTVVEDSGREGPKRYPVRERSYVKYIPGGNPQPRNGRVIGHIVDFTFVPVTKPANNQYLSYGSVAFVQSVCDEVYEDLLSVYPKSEVNTMMALAIIKILRPSATLPYLSTHAKRTFVCQLYPDVVYTKHAILNLLRKLGKKAENRERLFEHRISNIALHEPIMLGGLLLESPHTFRDISTITNKTGTGESRIFVLSAYDLKTLEPVYCRIFPGKSLPEESTIRIFGGKPLQVIMIDRSVLSKWPEESRNYLTLTPISSNDPRIASMNLLCFNEKFKNDNGTILCRKVHDDKFPSLYLYSFQDRKRARQEKKAYLAKHSEDREKPDSEFPPFSTIFLESSLDLEPAIAYRCYEEHALLMEVMDRYKNDTFLESIDDPEDTAIIGQGMIHFLVTILTCKMLRKAREAGLLKKMTFSDLIADLGLAYRQTGDIPSPVSNDPYWINTPYSVFREMEALGLSSPDPERPKRGRPRKIQEAKEKETAQDAD